MNYNVAWLPSAERELARIYNAAPDKPAVTKAANELDRMLRRLPYHVGESRYGDMRIAFEKPLAITFRVVGRGSTGRSRSRLELLSPPLPLRNRLHLLGNPCLQLREINRRQLA